MTSSVFLPELEHIYQYIINKLVQVDLQVKQSRSCGVSDSHEVPAGQPKLLECLVEVGGGGSAHGLGGGEVQVLLGAVPERDSCTRPFQEEFGVLFQLREEVLQGPVEKESSLLV